MKLKVGDVVKVRKSFFEGREGKIIAVGRRGRQYVYIVQFSHPYDYCVFSYRMLQFQHEYQNE